MTGVAPAKASAGANDAVASASRCPPPWNAELAAVAMALGPANKDRAPLRSQEPAAMWTLSMFWNGPNVVISLPILAGVAQIRYSFARVRANFGQV